MSTTDSTAATVVKTVAEQTRLIKQLQAADNACREITNVIFDYPVGNWSDGHAEGTAIADARHAQHALTCLISTLQIRLRWVDPPVDETDGVGGTV